MNYYIRKSFCTRHMLTLVWPFASMSPDVDFESAALNEVLSTPWSHARVRPLTDMYAIMPLKVRLAVEALENYISRLLSPI